MKIHHIYGLDYDSNIYVITGEVPTIIDCGTGLHHKYTIDKIDDIISPKLIKQIILTHEHFDHCGGVKKIYEETKNQSKVYAHSFSSKKIENGESNFAKMLGAIMPKMKIDKNLEDKDKIKIGDNDFNVIHTPGHTPGCICLYNKENQILFSGDTVFAYGSFGRYDFPGGNLNQLKESIEILSKLEIKKLYPGHESIVEQKADRHVKKSYENVKSLF